MKKSGPTSIPNTSNVFSNVIIIENINTDDSNMLFLKSLCCHLNTDINSVTNVKFKFKSFILTLNSIFSKDLFLTSLLLLKDSKCNHIFIRPHLSENKLHFKKLAYHAQITDKCTNTKCVFNRLTNNYELRSITLKYGK